jgi:hypothetical protein
MVDKERQKELIIELMNEENKYHPYTEAEYIELKAIIDSISTYIPNDKMGWVWGNHNRILRTNEGQPCSCGSASSHWIRATQTIRDFVKKVESNV